MSQEPQLQIAGVSRVFQAEDGSEVEALRNIDLQIDAGEFVTFIGPSGCGKSTLMRLIVGLDFPTVGTLTVNGETISGTSYKRGFVFQEANLFPWMTVWNNVAYGLKARGALKGNEQTVDSYIEMIGLSKFAKSFPKELSGGMAQRVALARSLINKPDILVLDEPLGALDALTRIMLQDEILHLWKTRETTMLLVTHDVDEAIYLGDRVVIMSASPGEIKKVVPIELGRPRHRDDRRFVAYRNELMSQIFELEDGKRYQLLQTGKDAAIERR